jgi:ketosteroid isomerase-like protein
VNKTAVDTWLDAYVAAWKSGDRERIGSLFADDVEYRYHPYDQPVTGREAVVRSWLGEGDFAGASTPDVPGTCDAVYRAVAVDGDVAVATGTSSYSPEPGTAVNKTYHNCFVLRFDAAGQCRQFTEWYMEQPASSGHG